MRSVHFDNVTGLRKAVSNCSGDTMAWMYRALASSSWRTLIQAVM